MLARTVPGKRPKPAPPVHSHTKPGGGTRGLLAAAACLTLCALPWSPSRAGDAAASGDPATMAATKINYSPALQTPAENNLYWGDLHMHTRLSFDAYINGTQKVGQEDAYRLAMGGVITADNGERAKLRRPLDFLAVTDHSENMGLYPRLEAGDPLVAGQPVGDRYGELLELIKTTGLRDAFMTVMRKHGPMPDLPPEVQRSVWDEVTETADRYYQPGRFTTLIGYEWTSMITGDNLHRVVIFRDNADKASQVLPINAQKDPDPETLWAGLAHYEEVTGGQVLAIAHNGNLSNGRMFSPNRVNGQPMDRDYAQKRIRWEPVYEATQIKGDSETHPSLSPTDEFASFERWDKTNVAGTAAKEPWMLQYEYVRPALRQGLAYERKLGTNPFRFGLVGSTDSHTGFSTTAEDNFFGKFEGSEPSAQRIFGKMAGQYEPNWELGASGLAAVWAPENTREAIFDAIRRKEVYATTGSRIRLRFFGGWDFTRGDIDRSDYIRNAYLHGVPMGGDLPSGDHAAAPTFLVQAMRDPDAGNLDRVQVIKAWLDKDNQTHETVYEVALSDQRQPDSKGKVKPVGNTVDVASATWSNSIGAAQLKTWWQDPDFDASQPAFYYVRVLEIPTPRWSTHDAAFYGIELPAEVPRTVQDRAYSSPIWYNP